MGESRMDYNQIKSTITEITKKRIKYEIESEQPGI
jgi:hypothetical protein